MCIAASKVSFNTKIACACAWVGKEHDETEVFGTE